MPLRYSLIFFKFFFYFLFYFKERWCDVLLMTKLKKHLQHLHLLNDLHKQLSNSLITTNIIIKCMYNLFCRNANVCAPPKVSKAHLVINILKTLCQSNFIIFFNVFLYDHVLSCYF